MFERPLAAPFTLNIQSQGRYSHFYTFVYFTQGLSDSNTCPLLSWPPSDGVSRTLSTGSPSDKDREGFNLGLSRDGRSGPPP
jgi:hypothetical protein